MKTLHIILFLLISANLFAQDVTIDSIKINVRKAPSIIDDADNPRYLNSDSNKIIIVDGVVTTNPINDSIKYERNDLLQNIKVYYGGFGAEYGNATNCPPILVNPNPYNWYISHSAGIAPEESEGTFYVSISTRVGRGLFLGLRGGIYTFQSPLDSVVSDSIRAGAPYSVGNYVRTGDYKTQGPSYIGALFGSYHIGKNISLNGSVGIRLYTEDTWNGIISFSIPTATSNTPNVTVPPTADLRIISSENILKPYFSIGADYKTGRFLIGVFGDNVFSFGANIGIGFN